MKKQCIVISISSTHDPNRSVKHAAYSIEGIVNQSFMIDTTKVSEAEGIFEALWWVDSMNHQIDHDWSTLELKVEIVELHSHSILGTAE